MIINQAKKRVLAKKGFHCKSISSKAIGLMFSLKPKALIFIFRKEKICPLHMFFVFYPIDVLFLNKNKEVVDLKENFKPFTFYTPKAKAKYVIELTNGTIRKTNTRINDNISF